MKTNKRNRRIKTTLGMAGALAGATLTGAAMIGSAQSTSEPSGMVATDFPFTTLRSTQRMHLNAANLMDPVDTADAPDTAPACRAVFRLFDSEGRVVATATHSLESGKTEQLNDPPNITDQPDTTPSRIAGLRGQLLVGEGRCSKSVIASMEIIDTSSGEVRAVIAPSRSHNVPMNDPVDTTPR